MIIKPSNFWLPKSGNDENEFEDAFFPYSFPPEVILQNRQFERYAIADGASTAYLSGIWAKTLVEGFGSYDGKITDSNFFDLFQKIILDEKWGHWLIEYMQRREDDGKPLPWYDEMALQTGSASTLLEISFALEEDKLRDNFSTLAIGDSCLFQIRDNALFTTFPLDSSADFDNTPSLISSHPKRNANLLEKIVYRENQTIITGDQIFLMTDALASWFFQEDEKGGNPWEIIGENVVNKSSFTNWIEQLRENKLMRNDDVTLMILKIQEE
jgi:hypothetical protein